VNARCLALATALALLLVAPIQAQGASMSRPVVKATINGHPNGAVVINGVIHFSPQRVRRGTILFKVRNADTDAHVFAINGVESHWIAPSHTATVTVRFMRPGRYVGSAPDADGAISGLLTVT